MQKKTPPFLVFKYLRTHMIDLGDDRQYVIPVTMSAVNTAHGESTVPIFDLDHEHKVLLKDETPRVPVKQPGMSELYHSKLCDKAYEIAGAAKAFNDKVRVKIQEYVNSGTLAVVSDPFEGKYEDEGLDPELVAAVAADTAAEKERASLLEAQQLERSLEAARLKVQTDNEK